jgi:hypothetical protein
MPTNSGPVHTPMRIGLTTVITMEAVSGDPGQKMPIYNVTGAPTSTMGTGLQIAQLHQIKGQTKV